MNIFDFFKKKEEVKQVEEIQPAVVEEVPAVLISQVEQIKPKKPRVKKKKPVPPPKQEPRVDVLKFDFDPKNPRIGSIELDWNSEFVELLTEHGYYGNTEEEIVDLWLNDVCKTIIANQFPGAAANAAALAGANMVNRKKVGEGKTEVS